MPSASDIIVKDPEIMGGTLVFRGTRVPAQVMFDYLESGETLEEFLTGFPTVSRAMAIAALEEAPRCGSSSMSVWMSGFVTICQDTTAKPRDLRALQASRMANF